VVEIEGGGRRHVGEGVAEAVVARRVGRHDSGVRVAGKARVLGDAVAHFYGILGIDGAEGMDGLTFWTREGGLFMGVDYS
jgi:hypothetical protein